MEDYKSLFVEIHSKLDKLIQLMPNSLRNNGMKPVDLTVVSSENNKPLDSDGNGEKVSAIKQSWIHTQVHGAENCYSVQEDFVEKKPLQLPTVNVDVDEAVTEDMYSAIQQSNLSVEVLHGDEGLQLEKSEISMPKEVRKVFPEISVSCDGRSHIEEPKAVTLVSITSITENPKEEVTGSCAYHIFDEMTPKSQEGAMSEQIIDPYIRGINTLFDPGGNRKYAVSSSGGVNPELFGIAHRTCDNGLEEVNWGKIVVKNDADSVLDEVPHQNSIDNQDAEVCDSTKQWYDKATTANKIVAGQCVIEDGTYKVFSEKTLAIRAVLLDEELINHSAMYAAFSKLILFDPGGSKKYVMNSSREVFSHWQANSFIDTWTMHCITSSCLKVVPNLFDEMANPIPISLHSFSVFPLFPIEVDNQLVDVSSNYKPDDDFELNKILAFMFDPGGSSFWHGVGCGSIDSNGGQQGEKVNDVGSIRHLFDRGLPQRFSAELNKEIYAIQVFDTGGCSLLLMGCGSFKYCNEQGDYCWAVNVVEPLFISDPLITFQEAGIEWSDPNVKKVEAFIPATPIAGNSAVNTYVVRFEEATYDMAKMLWSVMPVMPTMSFVKWSDQSQRIFNIRNLHGMRVLVYL